MFKTLLLLSVSFHALFAGQKMIIGIAGGTGSGKTTLANKIHEAFPDSSILISQDSYYKAHPELTFEQREKLNFDHPDSLEFGLMREQLIDLKNDLPIHLPIYNFSIHNRMEETIFIEPAQLIIVEGILLLAVDELKDLFDLKIFVDTDADIRILRRAERDMRERGRDFPGIFKQYLTTVKPMHELFVEPSKKFADIIIPEGGQNEQALALITSRLANCL